MAPAIFLVARGVFAGDQAQKAGNLAHVADLAPVSQTGQGMGGGDRAYAWQAGEKTNALS